MKRRYELTPIIDEIDLKILKSLLRNVRTNFADISKECCVSITTIQNRYNKLRKSGVIRGTQFLTEEDIGHNFSLAAELVVETEKEQIIIDKIKQLNNYVNVNRVVGKIDIHAIFHIKTLEDIKKDSIGFEQN